MKLAAKIALMSAVIVLSGHASADTANAAFTVSVTFTPKCASTNATPPVIAFGSYNAFAAEIADVALSAPIAVQCSRGLNPTAAFDTTGAEGLFSTGNLRYQLSTITKATGTPGTAATAASNGTADTFTFDFKGTLPQQAGSSVGGALTATRNLVLTF